MNSYRLVTYEGKEYYVCKYIKKKCANKLFLIDEYLSKILEENGSWYEIDRLDNSIGYIEGNIVPCCKICSNMKNILSESTFILRRAHIAQCAFIVAYHKERLDALEGIWNVCKYIEVNSYKPSKEKLKKMREKMKREEKILASKTPEAIEKRMQEIREKNIIINDSIKDPAKDDPMKVETTLSNNVSLVDKLTECIKFLSDINKQYPELAKILC